jgi:hypothetical protein
MGQFETLGAGKSGQRAELIKQDGFHLGGRARHLTAAETRQVRPAGMGTGRHMVLPGQAQGGLHHQRVAGVVAAGDVGGGDERHEGSIGAERVTSEGFTHITVEIDGHGLCHLRQPGRVADSEIEQLD